MAAKIKKGDRVVVLTGKDKGRQGAVLKVLPKEDRVVVQGVNMIQRHTRPTQADPQGGIRTREAALAQPMPLQNLDLGALLQDVIAQFRADWRRHGIAWQLRQPEGPLWCRGHPVALSQLLVNLLRNATQAVLAGAGADTPKAAQRVLSLDIECGPPPSPERPVQRWPVKPALA